MDAPGEGWANITVWGRTRPIEISFPSEDAGEMKALVMPQIVERPSIETDEQVLDWLRKNRPEVIEEAEAALFKDKENCNE